MDLEAMELRPDSKVITIASGGCNALSYLTAGPQDVVAIDLNAAHVALNRLKAAAVRALDEGQSGIMVALGFPNVNYVALEEVAGRMKGVPLDSDTLQTGRDIGISFGD